MHAYKHPIHPVVVDVFCGVGGLTHGLQTEGLPVVAGIDLDGSCQYAFEHNNAAKFLHRDVTTITAQEISALYPPDSLRILVGCAPCQPFSRIRGEREDKEHKWRLLYSFANLIAGVRPDIVSMENVSQLTSYKAGAVLNDFTATLENLGYTVRSYRVNALHYGVPQRRNRLVLFASRYGPIALAPGTHTKGNFATVREAIGMLPPIEDGQTHETDSLHRARKLSPANKRRIQATPEGGDWTAWAENLLDGLDCRKSAVGKTFLSAYGRMKWQEPAPTLTTYCTGLSNGRYGHPQQHRAISLREAALLQSFPASYRFVPAGKQRTVRMLSRHIGNAVPPALGQAIARSIIAHIKHHSTPRWA